MHKGQTEFENSPVTILYLFSIPIQTLSNDNRKNV